MHSWDQMKPRTVYEKAVQDFTETAQRLAGLNQAFEMLMVDDEVLKRYGLPKPMVERALIEVYHTVVLATSTRPTSVGMGLRPIHDVRGPAPLFYGCCECSSGWAERSRSPPWTPGNVTRQRHATYSFAETR